MKIFAVAALGVVATGAATTRTTAFHVVTSPQKLARRFQTAPATTHQLGIRSTSALHSSGKGFGKVIDVESSSSDNDNDKAEGESTTPPPPPPRKKSNDDFQQAGKKAYERMMQMEQEKIDEEIRAVQELRTVDEFLQEDPSAAAIPEVVATRMGKRMLPFVGLPLFGGMGSFVAFWYFATYRNVEFQPTLVAGSTIALLVLSLLGITYSVMSASWDPDSEGSALGTDEFGRNVDNLKMGLQRSRENAILREKMAGMPENVVEQKIRELEARDAARADAKAKQKE